MHSMKYHPALKKQEILHYVTTWTKLEDGVPSEINQSQKDNCCLIPLP